MPENFPGLETLGPVGIFILAVAWLFKDAITARLGSTKPKHPVEVAMDELLALNKLQAANFSENNRLFAGMGDQVKELVVISRAQLDAIKDVARGLK